MGEGIILRLVCKELWWDQLSGTISAVTATQKNMLRVSMDHDGKWGDEEGGGGGGGVEQTVQELESQGEVGQKIEG